MQRVPCASGACIHKADPDAGWPEWVREWVLPYVRNPSLWPVLVAVLGHVAIVLTPLMLAVWRVGSGLAGLGLVVLGALTLGACGVEARALRRPGAVAVSLGLTWAAAVALAWVAEETGFL